MLIATLRTTSSALARHHFHPVFHQSSRTFLINRLCLQQTGHPLKSEFIEDNLRLQVRTDEKQTIVEATPTPSGREGKVVQVEGSDGACALCRLNLKNLDYTDVKILSQFVKKNGSIVPYHESNVCSKQYRRVLRLIKQAWRCNLMERPQDYLVPGPWHDLNTYLEPDRKRDTPMKVIKKQYWKI